MERKSANYAIGGKRPISGAKQSFVFVNFFRKSLVRVWFFFYILSTKEKGGHFDAAEHGGARHTKTHGSPHAFPRGVG